MVNEIRTVGVIGAGQMGAGIAHVCASSGLKALLWDSNPSQLDKGLAAIGARLKAQVEKGKLEQSHMSATMANLDKAKNIQAFSACDLVIEAIVESLSVKQSIFQELSPILKPNAILGSNTSSISITALAASCKTPQTFMGIHFMNPVPVMKLVELIRGLQTSDETYARVCAFVNQIGKTAVLAIDSPGFVVNRILCPMINEAIFLLQQGVDKKDIDTAMKLGTNQPMGPLELADFVGLDTLLYILRILHHELGEDKYRPCPLLVKYVEAGWYGKKSGRGFYDYSSATSS